MTFKPRFGDLIGPDPEGRVLQGIATRASKEFMATDHSLRVAALASRQAVLQDGMSRMEDVYGPLTPSSRAPWWGALLGLKKEWGHLNMPGCDHPELHNRDGVPHLLTFHPYGLSSDTLRDIMEFADKHGLNVSIDAASWYFPIWTLLVCVTKRQAKESHA